MQIGQLEFQLDDSIMTQRTLKLRVGVHDIRLVMDRIARKLKGEVDVPGFRRGTAPVAKIRQQHKRRVSAEAFEEIRRDAVSQVLKLLDDKDQPFLPPEVLERDTLKVSYNRPLVFSVKYMVDPAGIGRHPENPVPQQGQAMSGQQLLQQHKPMGIPRGPELPHISAGPIAKPVAAAPVTSSAEVSTVDSGNPPTEG